MFLVSDLVNSFRIIGEYFKIERILYEIAYPISTTDVHSYVTTNVLWFHILLCVN